MTDHSTNPFPPLVVGVNRKGVRAIYLPIQIMMMIGIPVMGFFAVWIAASATEYQGMGVALLWGNIVIVMSAVLAYSAMYLVMAGTKAIQADDLLTLNEQGIAMNIPNGKLALPWAAIGAVQLKSVMGQRIATFYLAEGVKRDSPEVQTTLKPAFFSYLAKTGIPFGESTMNVPAKTILDATAAFTAGRLVAR